MIRRMAFMVVGFCLVLSPYSWGAAGKGNRFDKILKDRKLSAKLDPGLRAKLRSLGETGDDNPRLDLILKLTRDLSDSDVSRFRNKGIQVQSKVGDVVTVSAPAARVVDLAKNAKVSYIELPRTIPLNPPKD